MIWIAFGLGLEIVSVKTGWARQKNQHLELF